MQKQDKSINQKLFIKTVSEKYTLKLFLFLLEFKKHRNIDIAFKNPRKIKITHCFISEIQQCKAGNHKTVSIMPFVFLGDTNIYIWTFWNKILKEMSDCPNLKVLFTTYINICRSSGGMLSKRQFSKLVVWNISKPTF